MNYLKIGSFLSVSMLLWACGGGENSATTTEKATPVVVTDPYANWESNNGIGPVSELTFAETVDEMLAEKGKEIFDGKCTACHKLDKRFIGPSPKDIYSRRTPAWVMNMILDPDGMVKNDPMAKQLLMDFNGSPMANQSLSEDDARAVAEYFRTL